jgi:hypothetical protein
LRHATAPDAGADAIPPPTRSSRAIH